MSCVFTGYQLKNLCLKNRIVKTATDEGRADSYGVPSESLFNFYEKLAKGGAGLIITGMAHVRKFHSLTGHEIGIYDDELLPFLRKLTATVHNENSKIFLQIAHAPPQVPRTRAKELGGNCSPSTRFNFLTLLMDKAIPDTEIWQFIDDFAYAIKRAKDANFDGVQLHAGHGFLLSQFLSPYYNRRKDMWGGSLEKRANFVIEILKKAKLLVGADFPIIIKMNGEDGLKSGLKLSDSIKLAKLFEAEGLAGVEITSGVGEKALGFGSIRGNIPPGLIEHFLTNEMPINSKSLMPFTKPVIKHFEKGVKFEPCYNLDNAKQFAENLSIPVIAQGGIRKISEAEEIIASTNIPLIGMARPLIKDPALPKKWENHETARSNCVNCNKCFEEISIGKELRCMLNSTVNVDANI